VLLISLNTWSIGLPYSKVGILAIDEVLSIATRGFIGCNGHVRRTNMESLFWRGETEGHGPRHPSLALPFSASLFYITHDIYDYDLMPSSKISAHANE